MSLLSAMDNAQLAGANVNASNKRVVQKNVLIDRAIDRNEETNQEKNEQAAPNPVNDAEPSVKRRRQGLNVWPAHLYG
ncbi:hypothetical protein PRIPAC_83550 [Pristionchus pacificus]|uniref:Uncharacterized protein n=1 Tax=Pristionchus pacificus TaxID=54126 RepID=A0A2A6BNE1_PRIPA|nr:hypothetical protein PRIPAC_83550 [Pristionchus pacificus]|eukprot:PDM67281.1 hypothetical protein PRIPAC_48698 [Pristionchus pacificus]